jgi:hypothetical protein
MSQEHDKSSPNTEVSEGINPQAAPFEPGYQPETLPKISVPDLAEDVQGLTAEALAQIPTLTEEAPAKEVVDVPSEPPEVAAVHAVEAVEAPQVEEPSPEAVVPTIQDEPVQADTWGEALHARMGKLTDDIHTLNTRLDRLEERNKTKV